MIRIAIVDDHAIVRSGLKQFFSEQVDLRVTGEAAARDWLLDQLTLALGRADLPVLLLRSTLTAFNDANLTNNYSVLLGLAAPSFQQENNASKLAESFAGFRENRIDISAILVLEPRLVKPAGIDGQGLLRVTGYFPSRPLRLGFNIAYQSVEGRWRFAALAVDARPAEAEAEPAAAPAGRPG